LTAESAVDINAARDDVKMRLPNMFHPAPLDMTTRSVAPKVSLVPMFGLLKPKWCIATIPVQRLDVKANQVPNVRNMMLLRNELGDDAA
jgi:hypothetical protein